MPTCELIGQKWRLFVSVQLLTAVGTSRCTIDTSSMTDIFLYKIHSNCEFFIALVLIIHIHILQHNHVLAPGICSCWSQENRKTAYKLKYVDLM